MRIVLSVELTAVLLLLLGGESGVVGKTFGRFGVFILVVGVGERECRLVAAAPVIFELTGTPATLELVLALVLGHGVVEVP